MGREKSTERYTELLAEQNTALTKLKEAENKHRDCLIRWRNLGLSLDSLPIKIKVIEEEMKERQNALQKEDERILLIEKDSQKLDAYYRGLQQSNSKKYEQDRQLQEICNLIGLSSDAGPWSIKRLWLLTYRPGEYLQFRKLEKEIKGSNPKPVFLKDQRFVDSMASKYNLPTSKALYGVSLSDTIKRARDNYNAKKTELEVFSAYYTEGTNELRMQQKYREASEPLGVLRDKDPAAGCYETTVKGTESVQEICDEVIAQARDSYSIPYLFSYLKGEPSAVPFMANSGAANLIIDTKADDKAQCNMLNRLLWSVITALPLGKVNVVFVDPSMNNTPMQTAFINSLGNMKARQIVKVVQGADTRSLASQLQTVYDQITGQGIIVPQRNKELQSIQYPYRIVVLQDYDSKMYGDLADLLRNGRNAGIHFVAKASRNASENDLQNMSQLFRTIRLSTTSIEEQSQDLADALKYYVSNAFEHMNLDTLLQPEMVSGELFRIKRHSVEGSFSVPFGEYANGETANFVVSTDYPHTFIVGTSGSGKSVLLHNILVNAMLKYDPRYLELYLMDFKLGGVEMARYKDAPHVSHLLHNGSDKQLVLEIMKNLKKKMDRRGELIMNDNVQDIYAYNRKHPDNPMPFIMLVVDECHYLFDSRADESRLQTDINKVIEGIATQGRNQGVTFIMATQSFKELNAPGKLMDNITNRYMLRCSEDAATRLLGSKGDRALGLLAKRGSVYQQVGQENGQVAQVYFLSTSNYLDTATDTIRKMPKVDGREDFVFNGTIMPKLPKFCESSKPRLLLGELLSTTPRPVYANLTKDNGQNLLITGANDDLQAERVFFSSLLSLAQTPLPNDKKVDIIIIDNYGDEDDNYHRRQPLFEHLASQGVKIARGRERDKVICEVADSIDRNKVGQNRLVLALLGHQRYERNMLNDAPVSQSESAAPASQSVEQPVKTNGFLQGTIGIRSASFGGGDLYGRSNTGKTVGDKLMYILKNGGECGVHVIMQVNRPSFINTKDNITTNTVKQNFVHIVTLAMFDETAKLPFDRYQLDKLNTRKDLLQAYYRNADVDSDVYPLIVPYN